MTDASCSVSDLVFEDPPPKHEGGWVERLEPLMEHPGRWVNVTKSCGYQPNRGTVSALNEAQKPDRDVLSACRVPAGRWEFTSRDVPRKGRGGQLWARYLGK